jgi:hypothetical protein
VTAAELAFLLIGAAGFGLAIGTIGITLIGRGRPDEDPSDSPSPGDGAPPPPKRDRSEVSAEDLARAVEATEPQPPDDEWPTSATETQLETIRRRANTETNNHRRSSAALKNLSFLFPEYADALATRAKQHAKNANEWRQRRDRAKEELNRLRHPRP